VQYLSGCEGDQRQILQKATKGTKGKMMSVADAEFAAAV
jgi:hypothetical protein